MASRIDMLRETGSLHPQPQIGDVYRKDGGAKGYMVIVSNNGSTHHYIGVDPRGRITNTGCGTCFYFSRRQLVGRVEELVSLRIKWDNL